MTADIVHIARATGYDQTKVQLVKDTIAKGASDDELMLFLHLAQRTGLDPFTRQIYLIERRSQVDGQWKTTRQTQTGIDGLRLIAERSERYAPGREPTFIYDADGRLVKATAYVKKWVRGEWHEIAASAHFDEYVQRRKDGGATQFWADKPHIMLAKCAEALALRRAFPADMGGLYTADEVSVDTMPALPQIAERVIDQATGEVLSAPQQNGNGNGKRYTMLNRIAVMWEAAARLAPDKPIDQAHKEQVLAMSDADLKAYGIKIKARIEQLEAGAVKAMADVAAEANTDDEPLEQAALVEAAPAGARYDGELSL